MSLRNPQLKMSKSSPDVKSRINLLDKSDVIISKIKKAVTDLTSEVTFEPEKRPGISNLLLIHSLLTGKSTHEICKEVENLNTGQ